MDLCSCAGHELIPKGASARPEDGPGARPQAAAALAPGAGFAPVMKATASDMV